MIVQNIFNSFINSNIEKNITQFVGNKAKERISKRVFQENILLFPNTHTGGKKCSFFKGLVMVYLNTITSSKKFLSIWKENINIYYCQNVFCELP